MLEAKNVFIDTEYYRSKEFNFNNKIFIKFQELCADEVFDLFITSVVKQEVERQIEKKVDEIQKTIKQFSRKKHIFNMMSELNIDNLLTLEQDATLSQIAIAKFTDYLDNCYYKLINANDIDVEHLLRLYFNQKSPFSNAKKDEFPDAISLLSIEKYVQDDFIYIISGDTDLKQYCENKNNFIYIPTIEKLLDIYSKDTEILSEEVKNFIFDNNSHIESLITEHVEKCEAYNFSSWEDSELQNFSVAEIGEIIPNIIDIDDKGALVNFDIDIKFEVYVEGYNYNHAYHDKEDGKYYFLEKIVVGDYSSKILTVEMELIYPDGINDINIDYIHIFCNNGLRFEVDENSEYSY